MFFSLNDSKLVTYPHLLSLGPSLNGLRDVSQCNKRHSFKTFCISWYSHLSSIFLACCSLTSFGPCFKYHLFREGFHNQLFKNSILNHNPSLYLAYFFSKYLSLPISIFCVCVFFIYCFSSHLNKSSQMLKECVYKTEEEALYFTWNV